MPEVTSFGNHIVHNLKELAKFDLRTDIQKKGGSKLNINTRTGQFNMATGWGNAWNRNKESSLTREDNRRSVTNLLNRALDQFKKEGVIQNREFRKALIDGIRGYRWLLSSYIDNRTNDETAAAYITSLKELDSVQQNFIISLKNAINKMDGFHRWFATAQPEMRFENFGQSTYLDDDVLLGEGICAGISIKWLCRWVVAGKSSILDSSKQRALEQQFNMKLNSDLIEFKRKFPDEWVSRVNNYGSESAAEFQFKEALKIVLKEQGQIDPVLNRIQKKGSEMYIAQKESTLMLEEGGMIEEIMKKTIILKESTKKAKDEADYQRFKDKKKYNTELKKAKFLDDVVLKWAGSQNQNPIQGTDDFLNMIAAKYAQAKSAIYAYAKFSRTMYFCDASDFETEIHPVMRTLIGESTLSHSVGNRFGYVITWSSGEFSSSNGYKFSDGRYIDQKGSHMMGFHITANGSYLVFDPNYGEFECATGEDVIKHFSRWFSLYSRNNALEQFGYMKIYLDSEMSRLLIQDNHFA
jgi:hypothetical protein